MDEIFALWTEPLGEVHKSKISVQSLELYSKARANKVIKLLIIWLQIAIGKTREIDGTSTKTKTVAERSVMAVGVYRGITDR